MIQQFLAETNLPTKFGVFKMFAFDSGVEDFPHLVFQMKTGSGHTNVRIHSECMTGDVFSSLKCDCGDQLDFSMNYIAKHGGMVIYLRQEGRGIGLINKMKAYQLQEQGMNTVEANIELGFHDDERDYAVAVQILKYFDVSELNLLTNNPEKIEAIEQAGIKVVKRIEVDIDPVLENRSYLEDKKRLMRHLLKKV